MYVGSLVSAYSSASTSIPRSGLPPRHAFLASASRGSRSSARAAPPATSQTTPSARLTTRRGGLLTTSPFLRCGLGSWRLRREGGHVGGTGGRGDRVGRRRRRRRRRTCCAGGSVVLRVSGRRGRWLWSRLREQRAGFWRWGRRGRRDGRRRWRGCRRGRHV